MSGKSTAELAAELGIDPAFAAHCVQMAQIPEEAVEQYFGACRAGITEFTTEGLKRFGRRQGINRPRRPASKVNLDSVLTELVERHGFDPCLTPDSYKAIAGCGLNRNSLALAFSAVSLLLDEKPCTLRGLFYRVVSAGVLPDTGQSHYQRLGRLMTTLREAGVVEFGWLIDTMRATQKPPSWSGIRDFADTVRDAYRLDFWERLPEYVHVICEKDAIAGVLSPVCAEFDIALSPIRGYCSISFAHEIASTFNQIRKPITVYYLGDFDPSGFDLERDCREKLERYTNRPFEWDRLGVNAEDFGAFDLLELTTKATDKRAAEFIRQHGDRCAELDAIPATELRRRIREAITWHIPSGEWERLQAVEAAEKTSLNRFFERLPVVRHGGAE